MNRRRERQARRIAGEAAAQRVHAAKALTYAQVQAALDKHSALGRSTAAAAGVVLGQARIGTATIQATLEVEHAEGHILALVFTLRPDGLWDARAFAARSVLIDYEEWDRGVDRALADL